MNNKKIEVTTPGLMEFLEDNVQGLISTMPWMKDREFKLIATIEELRNFIDEAIKVGKCVVDFETTGLNTRVKKVIDPKTGEVTKEPTEKIVGVGLCCNPKLGVYVPINHRIDSECNLPEKEVVEELRRLCVNCVTIYHNAKFDMAQLNLRGVYIDGFKMLDDTMVLARLYDAGQKELKLKVLSERLLNQPMLKFKDMVQNTDRFDLVSPKIGFSYGASDAICTMDLYNLFINSDIIKSQKTIHDVEKRVIFAVLEMESNLIKIDVPYLKDQKAKTEARIKAIEQEIYELAGHEFNMSSSQQLGKVLFEEKGFKCEGMTESGKYATDEATLKKLAVTQPFCKRIIAFRGLEKSLNTYINNLLANHDEDDCIKLGFNQSGTDTGRFSSPGGQGLHEDGYCGLNVQSLPKSTQSESGEELPDMRAAFIARPGKTLVASDYENEEMRVATNISGETAWITAVNNGVDFHTATGAIIAGKKNPADVTPAERKLGKTTNFLALYLGGARTLAANASISESEARRVLNAFTAGTPRLKKWIDSEIKKARKVKYVKTLLGRTRPLTKYYDSGDRGLENHADRCVVNTQIQGCLQGHERCLTSEGYLPILEIKELKRQGKEIKVWTGVSWEEFDVIDRGPAQLAQIELSNGLKIDADTRHEVLIETPNGYEFKKFKDLNENTRICVSVPSIKEFGHYPEAFEYEGLSHNSKPVEITTPEQWDQASYLLGCVIGDGVIDISWGHNTLIFGFGKEKLLNIYPTIKEFILSTGLNIREPVRNTGSIGESYSIPVHSKGLIVLLQRMGYKYTNAHDKRVPEMMFRSPVSMRKAFLKGYYDTDGAKSKGNRHSFHTPNKDLLCDVQLLAWTLGCASYVYKDGEGNYLLCWTDTWDIRSTLGISGVLRKRRYNSRNYPLPDFLRPKILEALDKTNYRKSNKDRAYVCKIRKNRINEGVSMPGVIQLLKSYNCELPEMYYSYKLKEKRILNKTDNTYTLAVHSPLHRFDSAGIISKNTCADLMKAVMAKCYSWIHRNNLQDDVKMLITMHDELVFEVTTEKLELLVPELAKIMMLPEVITGYFHWPIPLTVDIKFGSSWRMKKKFFEVFPEAKKRLSEPLLEFSTSPVENKPAPVTSIGAPAEVPVKEATASAPQEIAVQPEPSLEVKEPIPVPLPEKEAPKLAELPGIEPTEPPVIVSKDLETDELIYTIRDTGDITLLHLNSILTFMLSEIELNAERYKGEKKLIKVKDVEGNSLIVSNFKFPADAFTALCRFFKV